MGLLYIYLIVLAKAAFDKKAGKFDLNFGKKLVQCYI
jgi:hypothetical protein